MTKTYNFEIINTYVGKDDEDYVSEEKGNEILYNWYENYVSRYQKETVLAAKIHSE